MGMTAVDASPTRKISEPPHRQACAGATDQIITTVSQTGDPNARAIIEFLSIRVKLRSNVKELTLYTVYGEVHVHNKHPQEKPKD